MITQCKHCHSNFEVFGDIDASQTFECEVCETFKCDCGCEEYIRNHEQVACLACNKVLVLDFTSFQELELTA